MFQWIYDLFHRNTPEEWYLKGQQNTLAYLATNPSPEDITQYLSDAHVDRDLSGNPHYARGALETLALNRVKDDRPRYGGVNGGPLVADVTDPMERAIREAFDQFDSVYLPGSDHWLTRQRTGRLCEQIIDIVCIDKK